MEYRYVGNSGLRVSELCLGTMTFGKEADEAASHAILDAYVEAGGDFIDTADVYGGGASEEIIGRWLPSRRRDALVVATKGFWGTGDAANDHGALLTDNLGATGWALGDKHLERLTTAGEQQAPYPHPYLARSPRRRP